MNSSLEKRFIFKLMEKQNNQFVINIIILSTTARGIHGGVVDLCVNSTVLKSVQRLGTVAFDVNFAEHQVI